VYVIVTCIDRVYERLRCCVCACARGGKVDKTIQVDSCVTRIMIDSFMIYACVTK